MLFFFHLWMVLCCQLFSFYKVRGFSPRRFDYPPALHSGQSFCLPPQFIICSVFYKSKTKILNQNWWNFLRISLRKLCSKCSVDLSTLWHYSSENPPLNSPWSSEFISRTSACPKSRSENFRILKNAERSPEMYFVDHGCEVQKLYTFFVECPAFSN